MPSKYAIQFAFEGTDYCGWQKQNGVGKHANPKPSIEEKVVDAIAGVCGEVVTVVASGRTDAGVHSNGQVAHFELSSPRESDEHFVDALNARLPGSIRVLRAGRVADSFKAQRAVKKQYSYYFQQGPANLPHLRDTTMWNRRSLDVRLMDEAVQHLVGKHDFLPFCGAGAKVKSTVREIFEASATEAPIPLPGLSNLPGQSLICVRFVGSGFLKHMIRSIAGTLKQIGEEMRPPEEIATILKTQDKSRVGPTAPASGLWLDRVWYDDGETPDFLK
ncbi:MAG: tRNA pseudouridine(38-40) synthase TruA [Verrucomicrobiales bacterium]|nr:tRNA pseudouridine(38-40) synthase TruA [Verrucomicrobiales bacterium]